MSETEFPMPRHGMVTEDGTDDEPRITVPRRSSDADKIGAAEADEHGETDAGKIGVAEPGAAVHLGRSSLNLSVINEGDKKGEIHSETKSAKISATELDGVLREAGLSLHTIGEIIESETPEATAERHDGVSLEHWRADDEPELETSVLEYFRINGKTEGSAITFMRSLHEADDSESGADVLVELYVGEECVYSYFESELRKLKYAIRNYASAMEKDVRDSGATANPFSYPGDIAIEVTGDNFNMRTYVVAMPGSTSPIHVIGNGTKHLQGNMTVEDMRKIVPEMREAYTSAHKIFSRQNRK